MGLREKVTITLAIIALFQISCRNCMPRTPRKASLKRYLNDLKPVKNNPIPTPNSPSRLHKTPKQTFGKTTQNGRICQNSIPNKSLYQTYKFPEIEYPLDNSPRDPFHVGVNFNDKNHVSTLQKAHNLQNTVVNNMKKEMKMKRKLLSNKQMNNENNPLKPEMSSIKVASYPDSKYLLDSESFPAVQYPLNTMDTWGQNYRSYLPFTQENKFNGQQTFNRQAKEDINKPFTRLTKSKASKYLQSYDKLKEEQRRTSTENSKRSNAGQKGLNFTKTATCEKISDDFITAGLVSKIPSNLTETKRTLEPPTEIKASSENTCPISDFLNHSMPIPYRVIENNTESMCTIEQKNNTKELEDKDTNVIAQTIQLIEEILFCDDTNSAESAGNYSKEIENNVDSSNCTNVKTSDANENILTTLKHTAKNCTDSPSEELSQEVLDDTPADILQADMPSPPEMISDMFEDLLSIRTPLPFLEPIEFEAVTNASERNLTNMAPIANSIAVPGSATIIVIPVNNNSDGKSLSQILETTTGTPIIVYLPSTQNSGIPSQTQIVSSSLGNSVPNNELCNALSNMAPLQNDNPPSTALVSELLNSITDSRSSLPMYETLPTNSMCYNNESSPSSTKEKPISDILIHKSLTDDAPLRPTISDEKLPEQPAETDNSNMNTETLPQIPDFEHPLFNFSGSEFSSPSHGPYNNVLKNELPILAREINSYQPMTNVASKDLFIPTQNVTSRYLQKNISKDYLPEIINDASILATLDQDFSIETPTDSIPETIIIEEMPPTLLTNTKAEQPLSISTSSSPTTLSESLSNNLSEIMNLKLSATPTVTKDSAPQFLDNTLSLTPSVNNSPMPTDMSIKTELYKIRQILDKMLSFETPTDSRTTPMDAMISPISDSEKLPMLVNESLEPAQTFIDSGSVSVPVDSTLVPFSESDTPIYSLRVQEHETLPHDSVNATSSDTILLPGEISRIPNFTLDIADIPRLPIDETVAPKPVFEHPVENKPYLIDNLVTPLSYDVPSKIDLVIPNIHELSCDELPRSVDELTITVHEEPIANPKSESSTKNFPTQVVEPQNFHSTKKLSIPEVLEATLPGTSSESQKTTMSDYTNKIQQQLWPSTVLNSSEDEKKQKVDLQLLITTNVSPSAFENENFLPDDSHLPINTIIGDFPHTNNDNKDVEDHLLSTENYTHPETIITNSRTAVLLSTNQDKSNDEKLSEYTTFSDLPGDDLVLTDNKILPLTDNTSTDLPLPMNTITTTSKLSIAKVLLENVLSGITKGGLSSLPIDKTTSDTANLEIPTQNLPLKMDKISTRLSPDIQTDDFGKCFSAQETSEMLPSDNPDDVFLPTEKVPLPPNTLDRNSLSNESNLSASKALLENIVSDVTRKGFSLPAALLQNDLSDVTSKNLPLPVSKVLPVEKSSIIDKTFYYLESPLSDHTEVSNLSSVNEIISKTTLPDQSCDNNLALTENPKENVPLEIDKTLSEVSSLAIPPEIISPMDKSIVDISTPNAEILFTDIPSDLPLSNPKALPVKSSSVLDESLHYLESPFANPTEERPLSSVNDIICSTTPPHQPADNNLIPAQYEETLPLDEDKMLSNLDIPLEMISPMDKSTVHISSPKAEIFPTDTSSDLPFLNSKTLSSSKLPITKALLQNVLSDVTSKGFSQTVSKARPVKSSSVLDKTFHYIQSPLSELTELPTFPHQTADNNLISVQSEETLPLEDNKILSEVLSLDIPPKMISPMDKSTVDISSPKAEILPTDTSSDVPLSNSKTLSSSYLPIAKALLQNVLSEVASKGFSQKVSKALPVKSSSVLDEMLYDAESPLSDLTELSTLPHQTADNNLTSAQSEETLSLEEDKMLSEVSSSDIPPEMISLMDKSTVDISSTKAEILPTDTPSDLPLSNSKTLSSWKIPTTKALLEHVLSDVTTKGFSLPVAKVLQEKSSSLLDKTFYHKESPLSDLTEESPLPSINKSISSTTLSDQPNEPFSEQPEDTLPLEVDKTFSEVPSLEFPPEMSSAVKDKLQLKSNVDIISPKAAIFPKDTKSKLPLSNIKTFSSSKLPITKALLQNVLSEVASKGFSQKVSKALPVKSSSVLDETLYDAESPLSDLTELSTLPHQTADNNLTSAQSEETLSLEEDKMLSEVSSSDIPPEMILLMDKSTVDISSTKAEILPTDTPSDLPLSNSKTLSSWKIPTTKALLEHVLSDVTTKGFSLPVAKVLQEKSPSLLNKTLYYTESPLSDLTEESPLPSTNKIISSTTLSDQPNEPFSEQPEDTLPLEVDKTFSEVLSLDSPPEMSPSLTYKLIPNSNVDITSPKAAILPKDTKSKLPLSNIKTLSSSKLPITKALLQNVLSDVTTKDFSLPVTKVLQEKSPSLLDKTLYYTESPLSDLSEESPLPSTNKIISSTTLSDQPNEPFSEKREDTLPLEVDKTLSEVLSLDFPPEMSPLLTDKLLPNSNVVITSPKAAILPKDTPSELPLLNTTTLTSSKLSITKALLENMLSDIDTKGFSLPVAKSPPVESRSQLDKTLYYMESPLSDWIEETSLNKLSSSEINEDVFELSLEKTFTDYPNYMPTDDLPIDQVSKDGSDNMTEEIEDEESTTLSTQVDKQLFPSDKSKNYLGMPQNKRLFASRIPITKALLEKVLSDINDGGIRP